MSIRETGNVRGSKKPSHQQIRNSIPRIVAVAVSTSLQVVVIGVLLIRLSLLSIFVQLALGILALIVILKIDGRRINSAYKLSWFVFIFVLPVFGVGLYLTMGRADVTKKERLRYEAVERQIMPLLSPSDMTLAQLEEDDPHVAEQLAYVWKYGHFPVHQNTDVHYFPDAAEGIDDQVRELQKAEKFIFMEYYAIQDSATFAPVLSVLSQKAAQGLDVRLIYDDIGSGGFITTDFIDRMEKRGIWCRVSNHVRYPFHVIMNNRDHRKITVIDGHTGYTGGYNLADLYTHKVEPYGFWKDTGVRIRGEAVQNLTALFLTMWNAIEKEGMDDTEEEMKQFFAASKERIPQKGFLQGEFSLKKALQKDPFPEGTESVHKASEESPATSTACRGFVQPYGQSPLSSELVAENVYINILTNATKYCYFVTPYLIITDEMGRAFELAAKRGVDVRIITPGTPDKKVVYSLTRSYYNGLCGSGVQMFEYTPGFCHAKMCISDDKIAVVGTINLDYRSLYLHFEDSCLLYNTTCLQDIRKDFEEMLASSREVTNNYGYGKNLPLRLWQCVLRVFAPLV